jgi:hypothetical protein
MPLFEIRHRWSGASLFSLDCGSLQLCLEAGIKAGADLTGADLRGADLTGADLRGANLRGADLRGADLRDAHLRDAHLRGAHLTGAHLTGADLTGADLRGADLTGADLRGANLRGAHLTGAHLTGAHLTGADLTGAHLTAVRDDLWAILSSAPAEVPGLLAALYAGRVDGSTYTGDCACLVGTLANGRACDYREIPGLRPNAHRPAERWFLGIRPGDTPATSPIAAQAADWITTWLEAMQAAFGPTGAATTQGATP